MVTRGDALAFQLKRRSIGVHLVCGLAAGVFMTVLAFPWMNVGSPDVRAETVSSSFLDEHLMITWYGNPNSPAMGVLGQDVGVGRADALRRQAGAYERLTRKQILCAYHLVAVVAQRAPGHDGKWRRREPYATVRSLLQEAREHDFKLILDVQPGRSSVGEELEFLRPFLVEPDVYLALDPEYDMNHAEVPGRDLGHMHADEVNAAIDFLERAIADGELPPKVLIVHQFTLGMLPDKDLIRRSALVDVVLNIDGFGSQSLKLSSYRAIMRQRQLDFPGIKLFFDQDTGLLSPEQVMMLRPVPSVVVYQ